MSGLALTPHPPLLWERGRQSRHGRDLPPSPRRRVRMHQGVSPTRPAQSGGADDPRSGDGGEVRGRPLGQILLTYILLALLLSGCGLPGTIPKQGHIPTAGPAPTATPLPPVAFPRDEAPHHNLTEWWYY